MIDVIVPVYRGVAETRACLESVLDHPQKSAFELVAIDDASPEAPISAHLDALASEGRLTLLRNDANAGFVRSANRGMALHPDRDVVLLNSDAEVANDWLDRLAAAAYRADDIATVTPFSNNATICSYPFEGWQGGVPGVLGLQGLDRVFATANAGRTVELPTAVGFCMYVRRAALDAVGLFDEERYGRGYGEENDFCMRSAKAGWRHLLAGDVFVFHEGSVSFSDERFALTQEAGRKLVEVHPDYPQRVHEFLVADPAAPLRAAVDEARTATGIEEGRRVLAERAEERSRVMRGLWEIERLAGERDSIIGQLNRGLEHATQYLAERDRQIARREAEIAALRAGLAYAEDLAFAREAEIARIHGSRTWRLLHFFSVARRYLLRRLGNVS